MVDFAHTAQAEARRIEKAKTLAAWCYDHGLGPDATTAPAPILRAIARAAGVPTPHLRNGRSPTWEKVADLLRARAAWDDRHQIIPPPAAHCVTCAIGGIHSPQAVSQ